MDTGLLLDPLFRIPFAAGLLLAPLLPLLGVLLRLRDEWLAALGLAHLAGAGALLGLAVGPPHWPVPRSARWWATAQELGPRPAAIPSTPSCCWRAGPRLCWWRPTPRSAAPWATPWWRVSSISPATHLAAALGLAGLTGWPCPGSGPRLIRARLFPGQEQGNRLPAWRWHLGFDLLTALGLAVGTATWA